jgi:hypothetical protein
MLLFLNAEAVEENGNQNSEKSILISFVSQKNPEVVQSLSLSSEELEILDSKPILDVMVHIDRAPYSMIENNQIKGYFIELLQAMVKGTGIRLSYQPQQQEVMPILNQMGGNRYFISTSELQFQSSGNIFGYDLIGSLPLSLDTLVLNKHKGGIRFVKQLAKMSEVVPYQDLMARDQKGHGITGKLLSVAKVKDAVRKVTSKSSNFMLLDYSRSQYYKKRDETNSLDLIRMSTFDPQFEPVKNEIGLLIQKQSPIRSILFKLYNNLQQDKLQEIKKKWLLQYEYKKPDVKLSVEFDIHELSFLNENKVLKYVSCDRDIPFEYYRNEQWFGFIKDVLEVFEETTGSKIEYIPMESYNEIKKLNELKSQNAHFFLSKKNTDANDQSFTTKNLYWYKNNYIIQCH